jgi:hypothetical protein
MKEQLLIAAFFILLVLGVFSLFNWRVGMVVSDVPGDFVVGENFHGTVAMKLGENGLSVNSPISVVISKGDEIKISETLTFGELITRTGKSEEFVERDGLLFSLSDEVQEFPVDKIVDYGFFEEGNYEFIFSIVEIDFFVKKDIVVGSN